MCGKNGSTIMALVQLIELIPGSILFVFQIWKNFLWVPFWPQYGTHKVCPTLASISLSARMEHGFTKASYVDAPSKDERCHPPTCLPLLSFRNFTLWIWFELQCFLSTRLWLNWKFCVDDLTFGTSMPNCISTRLWLNCKSIYCLGV